MAIEETKLAALKAAHPRGAVFELGGYDFFVRPPSRDEFRRFQQEAGDDAKRPAAMEVLAVQSVVYPDQNALQGILDTYPAFTPKLYGAAMELVGSESKAIKKG